MDNQYATQWFAGLTKEEKEILTGLLSSNNKVLDKLVKICYNMYRESETKSSDYESPNWALRQADSVGYHRALDRIIDLCTPINEKRDRAKTRKSMTNG